MKIDYKCSCLSRDATIDVPDRRPGSCINQWMSMVQVCISTDHAALSSHCKKVVMEYAKIPIDPNNGVGASAD